MKKVELSQQDVSDLLKTIKIWSENYWDGVVDAGNPTEDAMEERLDSLYDRLEKFSS